MGLDIVDVARIIGWILVGSAALVALVALVSPFRFVELARASSRWVDTDRLIARLDTPYDVDTFVFPHARAFGAVVLLASIILSAVLLRY